MFKGDFITRSLFVTTPFATTTSTEPARAPLIRFATHPAASFHRCATLAVGSASSSGHTASFLIAARAIHDRPCGACNPAKTARRPSAKSDVVAAACRHHVVDFGALVAPARKVVVEIFRRATTSRQAIVKFFVQTANGGKAVSRFCKRAANCGKAIVKMFARAAGRPSPEISSGCTILVHVWAAFK